MILFLISFGTVAMYGLPYMKSVFYDPMRIAFQLNHEQLGNLLSVYGLLSIIGYFPGGWLADKFSAKKLVLFSLVSSGLLGFYFASFPSYDQLMLIFVGWGITTALTYWSAIIKVIRMLGDSSEQGRLFGFFEGLQGIGGTLISFVGLYFIDKFTVATIGLQTVIWIHSILAIICGIAIYFMVEEKQVEGSEKISLQYLPKVIKTPQVWLIALIVFSTYTIMSSLTYLSPYLTDVFKVSIGVVSFVSIIRTYVIKMAASPITGFIADKIGSPTKVMSYGFILITLSTLVYLIVPGNPSFVYLAVGNMLILTTMIFGFRGIYFATVDEAKIPLEHTGAAVGLISLIGFSPDAYYWKIVGSWLDTYGTAGYKYIFMVSFACAILGTICSFILLKTLQAQKKAAIQSDV